MLAAGWIWQNLTESEQADLLEAIRAIWSGSATLKSHAATFWLHEAREGIGLPYAVVSSITDEIEASTGDMEVDMVSLQIMVGSTGAKEARDAAKAFRAAYHKAALSLGGKQMHCFASRVHGPMRDPERSVGGPKAWFCVLEIDVMHNAL